jgi:hypothetical protein
MGAPHPIQKPMPPRIARLARDDRGYPIPWNVLRAADGTPFFTVNDDRKHWAALRGCLCPICGERLGQWKWFVGGPRSAFDPNGWYLDLHGHRECVGLALQTCPYLAAPKYLGRIDIADPSKLAGLAPILLDETQIPERPDGFVAVASSKVVTQRRDPLLPYVRPIKPLLEVQYWRFGKLLTDGEGEQIVRAVMGEDWQPPLGVVW